MEKGAEKIPAFDKMTIAELFRNRKKEEMIKLVNVVDKKCLKTKRPMSEDDDEEIPLMEVYKRMKIPMRNRRPIRSPLSMKKEKKSEEEKKAIPVYELGFGNWKLYPDDEEESDEETLDDSVRVKELDWGCKFVINQDQMTYTRVKHPVKFYYKSCELRSGAVHRNLNYPVSAVSKKALDRYNAIEGTDYEYVGLVKAYKRAVDGFHYTLRFKARLPDQDPIYFQAIVYQHIPDTINKVVVLDVDIVHPLP